MRNAPPYSEPAARDAPLSCELPVLGIGVRFETNAPAVLDIIEQAFGAWRVLPPPTTTPVTVRVIVYAGEQAATARSPFTYDQADGGERVTIRAPGAHAVADARRREAVAHVAAAVVADAAHFRYGMLEAMTWVILTRMDRQPFHAAAIVRGDAGLLLWGPSGRGKSTLTYAAARAGFDVLTDDVAFLQQQPRLRVWGVPGYIHLPPEARAHFPELSAARPAVQANGKAKLSIGVAELSAAVRTPYLDRCGICILGERRAQAALRAIAADDVIAAIDGVVESGFDIFSNTIRPALRQLTGQGGWLLHPSADPADSLPLLARALAHS